MAASGLECLRSVPLLTTDLLPASSHACIVNSLVENSLCVASAGLDGQVRLIQFEDGPAPSNTTSANDMAVSSHSYALILFVSRDCDLNKQV